MFNNSLKLVRFILRRERISLPIWLISIIGLTAIMPLVFYNMYPTVTERQAAVMTMSNPAIVALIGPSLGDYTVGAILQHELLLFMAITVIVLNIGFVVRHTRADEELGRLELVRSLPVGRLSKLNATFMVAIIFNTVIAILTGLGLYATGVESIDFQGSLLFGSVLGVSGLVFAAITAMFAQLSSTSRGAKGYTYTFLIVAYIVRAIGDVSHETLARISPLGLILRAEIYVNNHWWPVGIVLIQTLVMAFIAFYLNSLRDLGAGFIPAKPGRETASIFLRSPLGLAWRLLRNTMIAWFVGVLLIGVSFGSILGELESFVASNELLQAIFMTDGGGSPTEQMIPFLVLLVIIISTIPVVTAALKLRKEEKLHLTEQLFARVVSRKQIMAGYFLIALLSSLVLCFLLAFGFWSAGSMVMDESIAFSTFIEATMAYLPAKWMMIGFALFLIGVFPSFSSFTWIYLGYSFFVMYFGQLLNMPQWLLNISPFEHIPNLPVDDMSWSRVMILTLIAVALTIVGFVGYQKRDIEG